MMSYLQSCIGCACVFSRTGKVFRQQQLLWPYCCCCAGRLLVLSEGNEQRVFNRIKKDECEQQLLVQLVQCLVVLSRTLRDISTPVKTPVLVRLVCTLVPRSASVARYEPTVASIARTGTTEGFRALICTWFGTFQSSTGASE